MPRAFQTHVAALPVAILLAVACLLILPARPAAASLLNFTGGNGSPITLSLTESIRYTVTRPAAEAPLFVFRNLQPLPITPGSFVSGSLSYTVNNGPAQSMDLLLNGLNLGDLRVDDLYFYGRPFQDLALDDVVTLLPGFLLTDRSYPGAPPDDGDYSSFLVQNAGGIKISTGGLTAAEPGYPTLPDDPGPGGGGDTIAGDLDGSGSVEQGDLDLVLTNWGQPRGNWSNVTGFTTPNVDQEELDAVLTRWGSTNAPNLNGSPIPEPASAALLGLGTLALRRRR